MEIVKAFLYGGQSGSGKTFIRQKLIEAMQDDDTNLMKF